ncbi:STAS domain-containing protein [Acidobacteriota bacterium]
MQEDLLLQIKKEENRLKIDIGGHLNQETSERLAQELETHYKGDYCDTLIACDEILFIGSAGFRVLLKTQRNLESKGFKMQITGVPIRIAAIIKSLGFDNVFNII